MSKFQQFRTRPSTVQAIRIEKDMGITEDLFSAERTLHDLNGTPICKFTATQDVNEGDYVITLSKEDTYHCPKAVFEAKYQKV